MDGRHQRRAKTEAKLLAAVGRVLAKGGPRALGVNAVAAAARTDKALIYRYYDGIEGLVAAFAASPSMWPTVDEVLGEDRAVLSDGDPARAGARMLVNYANALRRRPLTLDLLGWELTQHSSILEAMQKVREARFWEILEALRGAGFPLDHGVAELSALFSAAINYLAVRGRVLGVFSGLRIATDDDWAALERVFESALRAMFDARAPVPAREPARAPSPAPSPRSPARRSRARADRT